MMFAELLIKLLCLLMIRFQFSLHLTIDEFFVLNISQTTVFLIWLNKIIILCG